MEGQNIVCLRYVEQVILDIAQLYGIEEVLDGAAGQQAFPQMTGWFEGSRLGGSFVVASSCAAPVVLATLAGFFCQLLERLGMQEVSVRVQAPASEGQGLAPMLQKQGICYTISENNDKNNIKLTAVSGQEVCCTAAVDGGTVAQVQTGKLAEWLMHSGAELPPQKGCTLAITAEKPLEPLALGLARQLREEGFAVTVAGDDHADRVGAAFVCRLSEGAAQTGSVEVENLRTGRTDPVQLSEQALSAYIYEQTMMDAMEQVENSLESPKEFDFSKGFPLF